VPGRQPQHLVSARGSGRGDVSRHVFVDETKHRGYVLVASVAVSGELEALRRVVRGLVLPGQRRVHMKDENDSRKRAIAAAIVGVGVEAVVYDAGRRYRTEREGRAECLRGLVEDAATAAGHTRLVIEQDDSLVSWDSQRLIELSRAAGCRDRLKYEHQRATAEQLLAIPDAVAWCWGKGGEWRRRIAPAVTAVRKV